MHQVSVVALFLWALSLPCAFGLSWGLDRNARNSGDAGKQVTGNGGAPPGVLRSDSHLSRAYEVALHELQELESEPFCHRIAARLLVNNCQLLDGKDEATVLTDSGRQVRDFIDSYAASLAICDLERGNFVIPSECSPFREPVLSKLPVQSRPVLHVSSQQIEDCLTGLAGSDSAWNTWISYRHKAVRFCEAARADNEKAQNIFVYRRLTKIISELAEGVKIELQKRMDDIDLRARRANDAMENLSPQIETLREGLAGMQRYLTDDLHQAIRRSHGTIHEGIQNAQDLQQLLAVLVNTVLESNAHVAAAQEQSLERVTQKAGDEMNLFMTAMTSAVASSVSLQNQIELSRRQAADLAVRQDSLEEGMQRLVDITGSLSSKYSEHAFSLVQAHNITNDILDSLEATAMSAAAVQGSLFRRGGASGWWPYVLCPSASLILGSYGLPPSAFRNLALVGVGEVLAFLVSTYNRLSEGLLFATASSSAADLLSNGTVQNI